MCVYVCETGRSYECCDSVQSHVILRNILLMYWIEEAGGGGGGGGRGGRGRRGRRGGVRRED